MFFSQTESKQNTTWADLLDIAKKNPSICVFAPFFALSDEKDGYIRRIEAVDRSLLDGMVRFYLMGGHPELTSANILSSDNEHYYIEFDSRDCKQRKNALSLITTCGRAYIHSVYRFVADPVSPRMQRFIRRRDVKLCWDVHGAVPEEIMLNGEMHIASVAGRIEKRLYRNADIIICVSQSMADHLAEKYGSASGKVVVLPMLERGAFAVKEHPGNRPMPNGKPVVVYSGGLQKWQNVPEMLDLVSATAEKYEYRLFVSDPGLLRELWGGRPGLDRVLIDFRTPEEMEEEYKLCHYGLLLRDDTAVNRVSFPTKLMEYVHNGVVPVMKSVNVGDFRATGLGYVSADDLRTERIPDELMRSSVAENNRKRLCEWSSVIDRNIEKTRSTLK